MMGVLPGGTQAIDWGSRAAASNDALVKLYMSLLARREDRLSNNDLRRELAAMGYDKATDLANLNHENRMEYGNRFYPPQGGASGPSPLHRGGAAGSGKPTTQTPSAPTAPSVKGIPGSVAPAGATPTSQSFQKTAAAMPPGQGALMVTLAKLAQAREAGTQPQEGDGTNASDDETAGVLALANPAAMASGLLGDPTVTSQAGGQIAPRKGEVRPTGGSRPATQLPPDQQPRNPRSKTPPKRNAGYAEMDPEITQHMREMEDKYKLPRNTLKTIIGFENGGGYDLRKDANSSAQGWYAFTNELIDEWKRPRSDRSNIYTMTELAAKNLARNRNALEKATGGKIKLGDTVDEIPYYTTLHQWGIGNGPRIVAAMKTNPNVRMLDVMLPQKGQDNGVTLMNNGYDSHTTVGQYAGKHYGDRVRPWLTKAVEADQQQAQQQPQQTQVTPQQGDKPATVKTTDVNTQPQQTTAEPRAAAPRINDKRLDGVDPKVRAWIEKVIQRYPNVQITSGYRDHEHNKRVGGADNSQHIHRRALDLDLSRLPDKEKQDVLNWGRAAGAGAIGNYGGGNIHIDWRHGGGVVWGPNRSQSSLAQTPGWFQQIAREHQRGDKPRMALNPTASTTDAPTDSADAYQGGEKPAAKEPASPMFAGGGTTATDVMPKSLPSQGVLGTSNLLGKDNMTTNFKPASVPNSKQNEAFAGAPANVAAKPTPEAPLQWQGPEQPITRGQPPTAPPTPVDPLAGGRSPEYEGAPVPTIGDQPPTPVADAQQPPAKKGIFGKFSGAGPQPEKMPPIQGPERDPNLVDGQVFAGNIDVSKRPTALLGKPITVTDENGREVLIPSINEDGKEMTTDEAVQHYAATGKHLGVFTDEKSANQYSEQLTELAVEIPSQAVASKPAVPTMKGNVEIAQEDAKKRQADEAQAAEAGKPTSDDKFRAADQKLKDVFGVDKQIKPIVDAIYNTGSKAVGSVPPLPVLPTPETRPSVDAIKQKWNGSNPAWYAREKLVEWATGGMKGEPPTDTPPAAPTAPQADAEDAPWLSQQSVVPDWLSNMFKSKPIEVAPRKVKAIPIGPVDDTAAPADTPPINIKPVGASTAPTTAVPYGNVPAMPTGGGGSSGAGYRAATPTRPGMKMVNGQPIYWQYGEPEPGGASEGTPAIDAAPVLEPAEEP